jgi:MFS family permease
MTTVGAAVKNTGLLAVLLACDVMITLDFFAVNVALPAIAAELGAGPAAVQLVVVGYGLAYAAGLITWGRLGDLHGRRRMFAIGLGLFTAASAACGLAPSAALLIAARVLQGVAAGMMARSDSPRACPGSSASSSAAR